MKIDKLVFKNGQWHKIDENISSKESVSIIFVFGHIETIKKYNHYNVLHSFYPKADIFFSSTAGNILDTSIDAYSAIATAISFDSAYTRTYTKKIDIHEPTNDIKQLLSKIEKENLKHLFFFAPGLTNGSELLKDMHFQENISISGGFAGDDKFNTTYLQLNEEGGEEIIVFIALYGSSLHIELSSETGLNEFGSQRIVTKSNKNIVYEIDNKPAVELYKRYLGKRIKNFPMSALRFPLSIQNNTKDKTIRTVIKVNEDNSLLFSANIAEGSMVKLMRTNVPNILDSAFLSAKKIRPFNTKPSLALTISCAIRRNVLKQFAEEEIEIVHDILGDNTQIIGFYSYGEIAQLNKDHVSSPLKNQTITITTIYEA